MSPSDGPPGPRSPAAALAPLLAALLTAAFLAPWWNRFVGITLDGYFPHYGHLIRSGLVPYRDFFLHLPPLQPLVHAAIEELFGRSLVAGRLVGVAGRLALGALLALWLGRTFRPGTALTASLAAVWLGSGDDTDILDLYNHHALLLAVASGYSACRGLDRGRRAALWWWLSGVAAGLALATKQTIGLGATLAVPAALALLAVRDRDRRALARALGRFALGWSLPVAAIAVWLGSGGALRPCVDQVFFAAASSKGPPVELLARIWQHPFTLPVLAWPARIGLAAALLTAVAVGLPAPAAAGRGGRAGLALAALVAALTLALGVTVLAGASLDLVALRAAQRRAVFLAQFGIQALLLLVAVRALRRPVAGDERDLAVLALVGAGTGAAMALSWPAGEGIAVPGLAVVVAWALDGPARHALASPLRLAAVAVAGWATAAVLPLKLAVPFSFAQWDEPRVALARERPHLPELAGLRISPRTAGALQVITRVVRAASRPDEPVLVFSAMPIYYWLAERRPATFAAVHWFDVTPDPVVEADGARLLAAPPPVIVWQWIPRRVAEGHEYYFRAGHRSALRTLGDELTRLLQERYVLAASFPALNRQPPIEVYVRADRAAAAGVAPPADGAAGAR
jgi:hypothetical protein